MQLAGKAPAFSMEFSPRGSPVRIQSPLKDGKAPVGAPCHSPRVQLTRHPSQPTMAVRYVTRQLSPRTRQPSPPHPGSHTAPPGREATVRAAQVPQLSQLSGQAPQQMVKQQPQVAQVRVQAARPSDLGQTQPLDTNLVVRKPSSDVTQVPSRRVRAPRIASDSP